MNVLLLALLASTSTTSFSIDDFESAAQTPSGLDWALAVIEAQKECDRNDGRSDYSAGCRIVFSAAKTYDFRSTAPICTSVTIEGESYDTRIVAHGVTAFRIYHQFEDCPFTTDRDMQPRATIQMLLIQGTSPGPGVRVGIQSGAPVTLENLDVRSFTQNLRFRCGLDANTNCNGSYIANVRSHLAQHAGVYLGGPDANTISFFKLSVDTSCRQAEQFHDLDSVHCAAFPQRPECQDRECANIVNESFLGNEFYGTHVATARGADGTWYPNILDLGFNNASTWSGTYCEGGTPFKNWIAGRTTSTGGNCKFDQRSGGQRSGSRMNGFVIEQTWREDPTLWTHMATGVFAGAHTGILQMGGFVQLPSGQWVPDTLPLRFHVDPSNGDIYTNMGNTGVQQLRFKKQLPHAVGGQLVLPDLLHTRIGTAFDLLGAAQ